jgi:plastocyanin
VGTSTEQVTARGLRHPRAHHRGIVHAANDPAVTIQNFKFDPTPVTIHVGDTVTWTNEDSVQHSATANGGSFNTGLLSKGQSGSHTFTQPGTYAYICEIHPYMHGTIVVLTSAGTSSNNSGSGSSSAASASASGTGSDTGSSTSGTSTTSASTGGSGQTLPMTGLDVGGTVLSGFALLAAGIGLRRRLRSLS